VQAVSNRIILMLAADPDMPGGISAVIREYRRQGIFERFSVLVIPTFRHDRVLDKLKLAITAFVRASWLMTSRRVALVHVHSASRASFWRKSTLATVAFALRVPVVFHIHSGEFLTFYQDECGTLRRALVRWVLRRASQVIALTPGWAERLRTIEPSARLTVISNPMTIPEQPAAAEGRSILFLGRLREKKGVFELLEAFALVVEQFADARLVMAGDGDPTPILERAASLNIEDRVTFPGWIDGDRKDVALRSASLLVLPSRYEGLPVGVIEAMAYGLPVVCTRVGGIPEVVEDRVEGLLVPPGDVTALAESMATLLNNEKLRKRMGNAARMRAQAAHDAQRVRRQVEAVYESLGAKRVGQRRIAAVASGGGHWIQLLRLAPALSGCDVVFVSVSAELAADVPGGARFYVVRDATRWNRFGLLVLALQLLKVLWRERPDVILTTGAAPGYLAIRIGRWLGARTVWLDSIANVESMSLSGRRIGRYADLWLTQWEHLSGPTGPQYLGSVF
jgi:glycosyltransferase involved in cell wall biosynthesis